MAPPRGSHVLHRVIMGKSEKILLFNLNFMLSLIENAVKSIVKAGCGLDDAFP